MLSCFPFKDIWFLDQEIKCHISVKKPYFETTYKISIISTIPFLNICLVPTHEPIMPTNHAE